MDLTNITRSDWLLDRLLDEDPRPEAPQQEVLLDSNPLIEAALPQDDDDLFEQDLRHVALLDPVEVVNGRVLDMSAFVAEEEVHLADFAARSLEGRIAVLEGQERMAALFAEAKAELEAIHASLQPKAVLERLLGDLPLSGDERLVDLVGV